VRLESRPGEYLKISNERRCCATCNETVRQLSKCRLYRRKVKVVSNAEAKIVDV
jgi:hypothetical protein